MKRNIFFSFIDDCSGKRVSANLCKIVLEQFLTHLRDLKILFGVESLVMVAHHAIFDVKFLCVQLCKHTLWEKFKDMVCSVVDTLNFFRKFYCGNQRCKLTDLTKDYTNEDMSKYAHNAYHNALMLRNLSGLVIEHSPSFTSSMAKYKRKHLTDIIHKNI